jgi:hypothetical protein
MKNDERRRVAKLKQEKNTSMTTLQLLNFSK